MSWKRQGQSASEKQILLEVALLNLQEVSLNYQNDDFCHVVPSAKLLQGLTALMVNNISLHVPVQQVGLQFTGPNFYF